MEQQQPQGDPIQEALAGLSQTIEADMQAAEMIAQMGNTQAAEMLKQSAQLKAKALEALQGGESPEGQMQNPDTAGTQAQPTTMATR